jgi:hypothetical protein
MVPPRVVISPAAGPPGSAVAVSGTGFGAFEGVDIFVDTADRAVAGIGRVCGFGPISVTDPASAVPGTNWISAEGRHSRRFTQTRFSVNANWGRFHYSPAHTGSSLYENVLSASNAARLGLDWTLPYDTSWNPQPDYRNPFSP